MRPDLLDARVDEVMTRTPVVAIDTLTPNS
jgi:hypothetical protein